MDYKKFKEEFVNDVTKQVHSEGLGDGKITVQVVEKLNESYDAISIVLNDAVAMNLNINQYHDAYQEGLSYGEIIEKAVNTITAERNMPPKIDIDMLYDYNLMKDKLTMEVVSVETNGDLLTQLPHEKIEDMAIVYRFVLNSDEEGRSSILVTNNLLESYGITDKQLHMDAMINAPEIKPAIIKSMSEVMAEIMGEDFEMLGFQSEPINEVMFVATVPDKVQGASVIAYQNFMEEAAKKLEGDFFILPSSIHEILLIKDDGSVNTHELKNMVEEVNETQVSPEDRLTNSVYHYDSKNHVFELAQKFEARQMNKKVGLDNPTEHRDSVLKDLKDKQKESAVKNPVKEVAEKSVKSKREDVLS